MSLCCVVVRIDGLISRLAKVGPSLEPWIDLGLYDTDILSVKAREAGYQLAVGRDLFVHHFGTRTFAAASINTPRSN